jgi:ureidoglycolate hydrolase
MVLSPDKKNFRKYGKIIEYPSKAAKGTVRNLWRIVHRQPDPTGWRVAYLVLRDKTIGRLERHPDSDETFEPVRGRARLFVACDKNVKSVECFLLDKPIILYKGIWHGVVSLTEEAEIKIFENHQVTCEYWPLGKRVRRLKELSGC